MTSNIVTGGVDLSSMINCCIMLICCLTLNFNTEKSLLLYVRYTADTPENSDIS
jgi:hypothetical protein